LQAMAGAESMTVANNPADNSLIVVVELLLDAAKHTGPSFAG